jgi:hypothetical protein
LHRPGPGLFVHAELIAQVRAERVGPHETGGDRSGEVWAEAAAHVGVGELDELQVGVGLLLPALAGDVGAFGVALGADRDVLACCHRHRPGHQPRQPGDQDGAAGSGRGGHPNRQAGRRNDPVIGPEHRRAQPAGAPAAMLLLARD